MRSKVAKQVGGPLIHVVHLYVHARILGQDITVLHRGSLIEVRRTFQVPDNERAVSRVREGVRFALQPVCLVQSQVLGGVSR